MKLTQKEIEHIAGLARIELSQDEKSMYADQLSQIFDFIEQLNEISTEDVPITAQVTGLENVSREDIVVECEEEIKRKIIEQFPLRVGNLLKVKAVFKESL